MAEGDATPAASPRALTAVFAHHRAAAAALDDLLAARVDRFARRRALLLTVVAGALVGVSYLWLGFYVGVLRAVRALDHASERMRAGDWRRPAALQTRDELRLDFSKMEAGKLDLADEAFDPVRLVEGVVTLLVPRARERELALETHLAPDLPRALRGDAGRVRQVLLNLLGNAIKFTESGFVRVELQSAGGESGVARLRFAVSDSGIGIAEEARPLLFQEFTQVDRSATRRFGGTGLGLAISRRIVEAMGGEIGVESAPGRGSTFWFRLALPLADHAPGAEPPTAVAAVRPLRILIAEDNPLNQQVALGLLRRQGHEVELAADGREAVEAVRRDRYDVVLMDVHMPELDGLAAAREIRRLAGERGRVPIIALSASVLEGDTERCRAAGMDAHLAKPIDPAALAEALARHAARPGGAPPEIGSGDRRVLDENHLRLLLDALGRAKVDALIEALPADARPHRERLAAAAAGQDIDGLSAAAHGLKGIAANLGLLALAELTGAIEEACALGRADEALRLCEGVDACWDEAYESVRRLEALSANPS